MVEEATSLRVRNGRGVCGVGYTGNANRAMNYRAYGVWAAMIDTCYNKSQGKVTVDPRWHSFEHFLEDLPNIDGYDADEFKNRKLIMTRKLSSNGIDRIPVYSKDTCLLTSDRSRYSVGNKITNKHGQTYTVMAKETKYYPSGKRYTEYKVQMEPTKSIKYVSDARIQSGAYIKDPFMPSVWGIGYLGDYEGGCEHFRPYKMWRSMLHRCYIPTDPYWGVYGGAGVTVDERWHCFSNYLEDIKTLEGYNEELVNNGTLSLDKDKKQVGVKNKVYSKDTCVFLTRSENELLAKLKTYMLTSPEGTVSITTNLKEFCSEHSLTLESMRGCAYRGADPKNGWKIEKVE